MENWNTEELKRRGYKINNRKIRDIQEIWAHSENFRFPKINFRDEETIYSGAEHTGNPKLENVTFLPNITQYPYGYLAGTTFGHRHTQNEQNDGRTFQEIYEFQGFGGMLLRAREYTELVLAEPGEKIIVRTDENMTLFNLGSEPLITFDYANPEMNSASKDLEKEIGPGMLIWGTDYDFTFKINPEYHERELIYGWRDNITVRTKGRGKTLFESIKNQKLAFAEAGINIVFKGNIPEKFREEFSKKTLQQLVKEKNPLLFDALKMQ